MTAKRMLMLGCALGGLCAGAPAGGQAFNGTPATVAGAVNYDRATPGVETIRVESPTAIILWRPPLGDNPALPDFLFLPAGNVATFQNGPNNSDFVVLNRIFVGRPSRFDGTVLGRLVDLAGQATPGGTILFSSPGGIIIGATAVFDVGNLVLTSLNVVDDGAGNFYDPATRGFRLAGGANRPNAAVVTEPGAQIRALGEGSYVAMLAPRIVHGGSVRVNGVAAYVAGEEVELRANAGLFDIIVTSGSDNATPIVHTGTTGGPASGSPDDVHRIYMVAVPKNQAILAVLEGNAGFDPAVNAVIENGAIVLSAGANVVGGQVDPFGDSSPPPVPGVAASYHIRGGTISSDLSGFAVTDMLASGQTTGNLAILQDVSLFGGARAHLFAGAGETVTVGGDALVSSTRFRTFDFNPINLVGGEARIFAQGGGSVDIVGSATLDVSGQGVVNPVTSTAGSGTGGRAELLADGAGSSVRVRGDTALLSTGAGGVTDFAPDRGGNGQGGIATVGGLNSGQVRLDGTLAIDASGTGSRSNGAGGTPAATGTGGTAAVDASGDGSVIVAGTTTLIANGTGGNVTVGGEAGGTGRGGLIRLMASGTVDLNGDVLLAANGLGGTGTAGGTAQGGILLVAAAPPPGGTGLLNAGNLTGTASATGTATSGNVAGEWHVNASAGSTVNLLNLTLTATANGTPGLQPFSSLLAQGVVNVSQLAQLTTAGEIRIVGQDAGRIAGGRYNLAAGEDVTITHGNPVVGGLTIDVADLFITAGDDFSAGAGVATRSANQTDVRAADQMGIGGRILGRQILLRGAGVDVQSGGAVGDGTTESVDIGATGNATVAGQVLGGDILIASSTLDVGAVATVGGAGTARTELRTAGGSAIAGRVLGGDILITAANVAVASTGAVGDAASVETEIRALGDVAVAGTLLGRTIIVDGAAISVAGTGTVGGAGTDLATLRATNAVAVAGTLLGRTIAVDGATINVAAGGTVGGAGTDQATLRASADSIIAGRVLGGDILVTAANVSVAPSGAVGDAATVETELRATNSVAVAGMLLGRTIIADGGAVNVAAGGIVGGAGTDQATLRAAGNAMIAGRVVGRSILVGSADIDVQAGGAVGDGATERAELQVAGAGGQPALIGGAAQGPGYTLTGAEAGRIRAGTLRIVAPGLGNAAAILIRDLTVNGGGAAAGLGLLEIVTPGIARVEGNVLMANARPTDGISLAPTARLEVVTPASSVRVRDQAGAPGGRLLLSSNNIWIASPAILDRLRLDPAYAGRDADLLDNDGIDAPRGYIEADGVTLATAGTLFVQNSTGATGSFATGSAFGGITVGAGGLSVQSSARPAMVTAFGRRLNADGSFTTGDDFFFAVDFTAAQAPLAAGYTALSALNTCIIVTGQCPARLPPTIGPGGPDPTTGPVGGSVSILLPPSADEDDLVDTSFSAEGVIDEPVTSGGESNLWEVDCDRDNDGDCDEVSP